MNWSPSDLTSIISPESLRAHYVTLTDKLVHRLEQVDDPHRLHLLFLDKSGRPVAWLVRALWSVLARSPGTRYTDNSVPPMPSCSFANIDREHWWGVTGGSESSRIDVDAVPAQEVMQLRLAFLRTRPQHVPDPATVLELPTWLDGKHVVVVDEVRASGDTLAIAGGLVSRAFPSCQVSMAHWMSPEVRRHPKSGVAQQISNPVWYRSDTWQGRLVGNRMSPNHRGQNWRGKVAPLFLSTVPREPDLLGLKLRSEIGRIADDVRAGRLLAAPAPTREIEDVADRIRALYGFTDLRAFTQERVLRADWTLA